MYASATKISQLNCMTLSRAQPDESDNYITLHWMEWWLEPWALFFANLRPRDHVSHVLRDLHWLPIRERISYKVCLMMFNVVNGTAPTYMTGMVTRISDLPGRCHLRSAAEGLFDVPRTRTVFGSRAFTIAGPVAWNGLPAHVRAIRDVIPFKLALKTHFFQLAYASSL